MHSLDKTLTRLNKDASLENEVRMDSKDPNSKLSPNGSDERSNSASKVTVLANPTPLTSPTDGEGSSTWNSKEVEVNKLL